MHESRTTAGWGTWIRTKINGVRVRCSTVELSPKASRMPASLCGRLSTEIGRALQGPPGMRAEQGREGRAGQPALTPAVYHGGAFVVGRSSLRISGA